jgi:hypothetical protein
MPKETRITVRLTGSQDAKLAVLAKRQGCTKTQALRRLLDNAAAGATKPKPLDQAGTIAVLSERARAGSVPAARELLDYHRQRETDVELERLRGLTTDS